MTATLSAPTRETTPLTLDEERTAHDLLDSIPPNACDWATYRNGVRLSDPCPAPATWALIASCGHVRMFCTDHRVEMVDYLNTIKKTTCYSKGHPPMRFTYEWRPLDV